MTANHTLLVVHGMGKPDDQMFNDWKTLLAKHYRTYAPAGERFEDVFNYIPINYDGLFENLRQNWKNQIKTILDNLPTNHQDKLTKADLESFTEDNFFTTHIMDVLLYRFNPLVAGHVRDFVIEKMLAGINDLTLPGSNVSIIAHSLGTAVVHDAINVLYNTTSDSGPLLKPSQFRFHAIIQLANVSRTLEVKKWDAYDPYVRPGIHNSSDGRYAASRMLSASHCFDPLVSVRRFHPIDNWPDPETVAAKRFTLVEPSVIQRWNVHDFSHYIDDPRVHIPMFRYLRTKGFVSASKESEVVKAFDESNPISKFDAYRHELKQLVDGEAGFSWKRLLMVAQGYAKLMKEYSES